MRGHCLCTITRTITNNSTSEEPKANGAGLCEKMIPFGVFRSFACVRARTRLASFSVSFLVRRVIFLFTMRMPPKNGGRDDAPFPTMVDRRRVFFSPSRMHALCCDSPAPPACALHTPSRPPERNSISWYGALYIAESLFPPAGLL